MSTQPPTADSFEPEQTAQDVTGSILSTQSGPSTAELDPATNGAQPNFRENQLADKRAGEAALAASVPSNPLKASEYAESDDPARPMVAARGEPVEPADDMDTASTISETIASDKVGFGEVEVGYNPSSEALDRVRVDSGGREMTSNQGVAISDNQNSATAGLRGPTLMEDFLLREKITHFDHERIPERVVHARGSGAHGYFECYEDCSAFTMAAPFAEADKQTPVFVRFSTVAGERGSTDLARDVRGFAVKFYSDHGNWDLVGNNMPVFFIQDAMKFPDLVHALKPEPHFAMPQAASAHDTFWDFVSLMPETTHMLMWVMSDRAIPRSYRMMEGFGVHSFRLINAQGESVFCKFHWKPLAGTHSLVWDEAVKVSGADADYHRRDLWESIEAGVYPTWELGVQLFTEEDAAKWSFDILDATKLVPEELVPVKPVGRMVLNRNPDNFFAETEQVAFCTAHIIPGIDFTNDPLLQGRIHSYVDTQISRLGGANFHEIPINAPLRQVHNNQRDGVHRQAINRGRVNYEPNSLGGGCPFQAGSAGFVSFPEPVEGDKVRGKPERFADHYTQARLFWLSQSPTEQNHIVGAFRFELTRVQTPAIRLRTVSMLANVDATLAERVASGLGIDMPEPMPSLRPRVEQPEVAESPALSLMANPGDGSIAGRRVALLVADGVNAQTLHRAYGALAQFGAAPRFVGTRLGNVMPLDGPPIAVEISLESAPSVLWDALIIGDGVGSEGAFPGIGQAIEFIKDQYRHCKPILAFGDGAMLLDAANIPRALPNGDADSGLLICTAAEMSEMVEVDEVDDELADAAMATSATFADIGVGDGLMQAVLRFMQALAKHRHFERETDPPLV